VIRTQKGQDEYLLDNFVTGPATTATVMSASKEILADKDMWKKVYDGYKTAQKSDTNGFIYNGTLTEAMTSALNEVWESYRPKLVTGTVDPDVAMAEIKEQMEAIGVNRLIEEAQKQFDTYLSRLSEGG
jgi:putative aldouronate transport system substrate-binding protein